MVDLNALEKLLAAATQGKWVVEAQPDMTGADTAELVLRVDGRELCRLDPQMVETGRASIPANAALIAALHNAAPELLKMAREYQRMMERARGRCDMCAHWLVDPDIEPCLHCFPGELDNWTPA